MDAISIVRRLHQHRQCSNHRLLASAEQLTESQLHQRFPIGQGTIWLSLTHLYGAEYVWLEALCGNESPLTPGDEPGKLPGNQQAGDALTSLAELRSRWSELDERWNGYLTKLAGDSLSDVVYKANSLTGQRAAARRSDILLHVCTHAQYTVAQAINMMRHVGVSELPDSMLITLARSDVNGGIFPNGSSLDNHVHTTANLGMSPRHSASHLSASHLSALHLSALLSFCPPIFLPSQSSFDSAFGSAVERDTINATRRTHEPSSKNRL